MGILDWLKPKQKIKHFDSTRYIDLETPCHIDEHALITRNGGRVTLIKVNGSMNILGETGGEEFSATCESVLSMMRTLFNNDPDVSLTWTYEQDPELTEIELRERVRPSVNAAATLGLEVADIFEELVQGNGEYCMSQDAYVAVWTTPIPQQEYVDGKLTNVETENVPLMRVHDFMFKGSANPFLSDLQTIKKHQNYVKTVIEKLRQVQIICDKLKGKEAGQEILRKINRGDHAFTPIVYPDALSEITPATDKAIVDPQTGRVDVSSFMAPSMAEQLVRRNIHETKHEGVLKVGNIFYATHTIDVFPKQRLSFNKLRKALKGTPFRMTFIIKPKPVSMLSSIHAFMNDHLAGLSEDNREAYRQMQLMRKNEEEKDIPSVFVQILLTTWANNEQDVLRYSSIIGNTMTDWGGARVEYDNVSPFQTFFTNIAGVSTNSHCLGTIIGVDRLIGSLPHQLESSLESYGPIIFRHDSGKIASYNPNSNLQDYDYTIYLARPRQGKSLLMNMKAFMKLLAEGASTLPLITSIDIGPSSEGELQLVRMALEKRFGKKQANRMVVSQLWDPSRGDWKINPNDIRLGRNYPTKQEMEFITNFYHSVCADADTGRPIDGGADIINVLVERTFLHLATAHGEKIFSPALAPRLLELAKEYDIAVDRKDPLNEQEKKFRSYYELRDEFFLRDCIEGASLAHRYAMPTVQDYIAMLTTDPTIQDRFKIYREASAIIAHKLKTHLMEMPHLTRVTTIDFSEASVISFDLKPIAEGATDNASRIRLFTEYMLAMNVGMNKFFINDSILQDMSPMYVKYWKDRIDQFSQVDKCLNLDEWHSLTIKSIVGGEEISMPVAGSAYIEWLIKQAPKWRMNINQASHSSADFTSAMKDLATNVFIYSGTKGKELERITKDFGLTKPQVAALTELHSPDERGSQMLWLYSVRSQEGITGVRGSAKVEFLCCGSMLWGLNTSAKDLPHKLKLEREHSGRPWLKALCKAYPNGSMEKHRSGIIAQLRESNMEADQVLGSVEDQLYSRVCQTLVEMEYGKEVLADVEAIKKKIAKN